MNQVRYQESKKGIFKEVLKERYYGSVNKRIVELVPEGVHRILDVGCGWGATGSALKELRQMEVVGIEENLKAAQQAKGRLDEVIMGDVERLELPFSEGYFDCIIYADVLEHLRDPWTIMVKHRRYLNDKGWVISSIPNVRNCSILQDLIMGEWRYAEAGLLDITHLRFFTLKEIIGLFEFAGYKVETLIMKVSRDIDESLSFWKERELGKRLSEVANLLSLDTVNPALKEEDLKELLTDQYLIRARRLVEISESNVQEETEDIDL